MDFSEICRTCLSHDNLNPIFINQNDNKYLETIFTVTGVKMNINDGYPQNMCTDCSKSFQNALVFRKMCKESETQLIAVHNENRNKIAFKKNKHLQPMPMLPNKNQNTLKKLINTEKHRDIKSEYDTPDDEDDKPLIFLTENSVIQNSNNTCKETENIDQKNLYDCNGNSSRITCKLCQKNLSRRSFNMHMARHHPGADDTRIKCELCNEYILKDNLDRHLVSIHGTDSFKCRYCKKEFKKKDLLVKHITNCTIKKRRRACESSREVTECDECHKKMQKASLRMHKAIKHAGLGPVCEHCGKRFGNKFRLNEHYRAKHDYEKFKCKYCDFQSAGVMAMRNHERRHRGEKPFICETCGAKFHAAYLLAQHKQSHRTEKRFKCELCPAAFKANNSLHMHRRACHSSARYSCAVCARAYSCRHYAVKHMRAVHRYAGPVPALAQT